jgi:GNAT superfamily N-acetyltransferase
MTVRRAEAGDVAWLAACEWPVRADVVERGECVLAVGDGGGGGGGEVWGYAIFNHAFFKRGFVPVVYVRPDRRRAGVGSALLAFVEGLCGQPRIWSSVHAENAAMQQVLIKRGYQLAGLIHGLGHVPELFYYKDLPKGRGRA